MKISVLNRAGLGKWFPAWTRIAACLALVAGIATVAPAKQPVGVGGKRDITIMTQNLYIGSSLSPVTSLDPADTNLVAELLTGVATIYGNVIASDFPNRADALAREIVAQHPDLVALQEVTLIREQSPGDAIFGGTNPATNVVADYLRIVLKVLRKHGGHYAVVSKVRDVDVELPMPTVDPSVFNDLRVTDRDVMLARTDLPTGYLRILKHRSGNFTARLPLPIGVDVLRGWCSADVFVRGRRFRVINAHLEEHLPSPFPDIQAAQAAELLAGPAKTALPVILVGDFNSDAYGTDGSTVYPLLTGTGHFNDAWTVAHPNELGLTWGHDDFLSDPTLPFTQRLDLMLYRGQRFSPTEIEVLDPTIASLPSLWISDHGGVISTLSIR